MTSTGWFPGIPVRLNHHMVNPPTALNPSGVTLHRTYGFWVGDQHTLLKGRVPSTHFLVGKESGQWLQMVSARHLANHSNGSNSWSIGIEFSGKNEEPLTQWQLISLSKLIKWTNETFNIPRALYPSPGKRVSHFNGWISHGDILSTKPHTDRVTMFDWGTANGMVVATKPPSTPSPVAPPTILDVKEENVLAAYPVPIVTPNAFGVGETFVEFNRTVISAHATLNGGPLLNHGVAVECHGTRVRVSCWGLTSPVGVHVWAIPAS